MREQETRTAFLMEDVETAEALDDRTLEIRLREPRSYFPYILASAWSFPWPRHRCEELGDDWARPENLVGNGPFVLAEYTDEHALLTGQSALERPRAETWREIHVAFKDKGEHMLADWHEGRFDLLHVWEPVPPDEPDTHFDVVPELGLQYVGFNARPSRRSRTSSFARRSRMRSTASSSPSPIRRMRAAGDARRRDPARHARRTRTGSAPEYDPERARTLLAEAGYPEGKGLPELEIVVPLLVPVP